MMLNEEKRNGKMGMILAFIKRERIAFVGLFAAVVLSAVGYAVLSNGQNMQLPKTAEEITVMKAGGAEVTVSPVTDSTGMEEVRSEAIATVGGVEAAEEIAEGADTEVAPISIDEGVAEAEEIEEAEAIEEITESVDTEPIARAEEEKAEQGSKKIVIVTNGNSAYDRVQNEWKNDIEDEGDLYSPELAEYWAKIWRE